MLEFCSLFLQDWKMEVYVYYAEGSAKGCGPYGLSGSVGGIWCGCNGLLMVSGEDELLLNELNEKLGMPHWQNNQDVLLLSARI